MTRYIVPRGFEATAHKIFFEFVKPPSEVNVSHSKESEDEKEDTPSAPDVSLCNHCPICLSDYTAPVTLVMCMHSYCMECLLLWFAKKIQCPLCKTSGRLFVRSDELSSNKGVRVFSVGTIDSKTSTGDIKRAIQIHRQRFIPESASPPSAPPAPDAESINMLHCETPNRKRIMQNTSDRNSNRKERRRNSSRGDVHSACGVHSLLGESSISCELGRVRKGLARAAAHLADVDNRIRKFDS